MIMKCDCEGCVNEAQGHMSLGFYAHQGLMKYYRCTEPLAHITTPLHYCQECCDKADAPALFNAEHIAQTDALIEKETGTVVDPKGHKKELLPCTHPTVVAFMQAVAKQQMGQYHPLQLH